MDYRIKIIQKYNGDQSFIPQYRNNGFGIKNVCGIILFPILLLMAISNKDGLHALSFFFVNWDGIPYDEDWKHDDLEVALSFSNSTAICENEKAARHIIELHRTMHLKKLSEKETTEAKQKAGKVKKTTYIQVN